MDNRIKQRTTEILKAAYSNNNASDVVSIELMDLIKNGKTMEQEQTKKFDSNKSIEKEIKQYIKLINGKNSKYESLAEMKRQFLSELCSDAYSDEYLELLKEIAKVRVLNVNESISVGTPMWNALNIAILTLIATINGNDEMWHVSIFLILLILSISFRKKTS